MNRIPHLRWLLGTTVLATVITASAGQAFAQAPAAPPAKPTADAVEEVVVTGTRIRRPNLEASNPVSVVDAREIEISGLTDIADILQRQPQVGIGSNTSTTTNSIRNQGLETLSLRNLGTARTLTLVNGHRQVGGGVGSTAVDVNTINPTLLDRIDIVTGGSSAIYGADAIAGVVNFIQKRDFEGIAYKAQYGDSYHGGGGTSFGSLSVGHNFDHGRGNVTLSVLASKTEPIFRYDRGYALSGLAGIPNPARSTVTGVVNAPAFIAATGVRTNIYGSSDPTGDVRTYSPAVLTALGTAPAFTYTFDAAGTNAILFNRGTVLKNNLGTNQTSSTNCSGCLQSYLDALATGIGRNGFESTGRYDLVADRGWIRDLEVFYEAKYYSNQGWSQSNTGMFAGSSIAYDSAPRADAGLPSSGAAYPIRTDNAYIPANLKALVTTNLAALPTLSSAMTGIGPVGTKVFYITRIDNDFGTRDYKTDYKMFETVAGFRGSFKNGWHFDSIFNYGETKSDAYQYDRDIGKFFQQIDAVQNPSNPSQIICRSTIASPSNGCVPINIFSQTHSAAEKAYSYQYDHEKDKLTMLNYQLNLNGDLFHYNTLLGHTNVPVSFALGYEYRRESSFANPDPCNQVGSCWSNFVPITKGAYSTNEVYGELNVPVIADVPFIKRLEFDLSGRAQDYSSTGFGGTYGASANWNVNDEIKLRGVYSKAVRAPNINELYASGAVSYAGITDPCDSNNVNLGQQPTNRRANCIALLTSLGVNPLTGPGGAYNFTQSTATKPTATLGNPKLDPERAQTWTGGIVWQPKFLKGFSFTADYYDIKIKGAIASLAISAIVNNCVDSPTTSNQFCPQVTRGVDGNVTYAQSSVFNVATFLTRGEDFGASYRFNVNSIPWTHLPDLGTLTFNVNANHVEDLLYLPVAGDDTTRQQGAGALNYDQPRFRFTSRVTWDYGPWNASFATTYYGPMNLSNQDKYLDFAYERVPEWARHDVRVAYKWRGQTFYAGVDNVTDEDPPYIPGVFTGTGTGSIYGPTGRYIYVGVSGKF